MAVTVKKNKKNIYVDACEQLVNCIISYSSGMTRKSCSFKQGLAVYAASIAKTSCQCSKTMDE